MGAGGGVALDPVQELPRVGREPGAVATVLRILYVTVGPRCSAWLCSEDKKQSGCAFDLSTDLSTNRVEQWAGPTAELIESRMGSEAHEKRRFRSDI